MRFDFTMASLAPYDMTTSASVPMCVGRYASHWRMYDAESKSLFGPHVWCSVIVDQSLSTEPCAAAEPSATMAGNSGVDVGLSTEDLFAFVKTLEMTAAKKPGPLAVPTNTPLGQSTAFPLL